jgi:hypothetical protein
MELHSLIDTYCLAWSKPPDEERTGLLEDVWSPKATYTYPTVHGQGSVVLVAQIAFIAADGNRIEHITGFFAQMKRGCA